MPKKELATMDQRRRLKKFRTIAATVWFVLGASLAVNAGRLQAEPLPELHYVGVVPAQWDDPARASYTLGSVKNKVDELFLQVASRPNKFFILNNDLVASLWANSNGRRELVTQHELHGFVALSIVLQDDVVVFHARILSPELDGYLLESETVTNSELRRADDREIDARLSDLVFRLYNRIPVDVRITSIQGRFVTLSGGERQNVREGERLEIERPVIASRHPANDTWMRIETKPLGTVRVVEVKRHTAVAVIERQIEEHAMSVGDGARVADIGSRARFRVPEGSALVVDQGPVIISPLYPNESRPQEAAALPLTKQPDHGTRHERQRRAMSDSQGSSPAGPSSPRLEGEAVVVDPGSGDGVHSDGDPVADKEASDTLYELIGLLVDEGQVHAGVSSWSYKKAAKAEAQFPMILVNHIGLSVVRQLAAQLYSEAQFQLHFGSTKKGSFFGFDAEARGYLKQPVSEDMHWRAGGLGGMHSLAVEDESYGGGDIFFAGGFVGLEGRYSLIDNDLAFYGELGLVPIMFGQMGIGGEKKNIESALAHHIRMQVSLPKDQPGLFEWGLRIETQSKNFSLQNNQKIQATATNLQVLAKYYF